MNGALFRAGDLQTPMTEDTLENVAKLDKLLKGIKAHSPDTLKRKIEDAGGFTLFWDQEVGIESRDGGRLGWQISAVESAILATVLRILGSEPQIAEWMRSETNAAKSKENDYLLSRAIIWGVPETIQLLLDYGADPRNSGID